MQKLRVKYDVVPPLFASFPLIAMACIILISSSNAVSGYPFFWVPNKFHTGPGKSFLAKWRKHWQTFPSKVNICSFLSNWYFCSASLSSMILLSEPMAKKGEGRSCFILTQVFSRTLQAITTSWYGSGARIHLMIF